MGLGVGLGVVLCDPICHMGLLCYLSPDTSEALTPASKLVLDLPTLEGWKAELTYSYPVLHRPGVELSITSSTP